MKGPWHRQGKGERLVKAPPASSIPRRMQYRFSRTTVQPPSGFRPQDVSRSARLPQAHLNLQHVYGFRGQDYASHGNALYISTTGEVCMNVYSRSVCWLWDNVLLSCLFFSCQSWLDPQQATYFAAGVGILMNVMSKEQRFLVGHSDDITCMSVNHRRTLAVTGQMGAHSSL